MVLEKGMRLGPYEVQAPIGAGGMGEVYRARDARLDRLVAVKVLPPHLATDVELRQRFEREARLISSLNHPHICTLHDIGNENGLDYLVMEYIDGQTLSARLGRGPLPLQEALRYAIQIADALDKAHRKGVIHRDLKPGNIMITKAGAKLLDFGLARSHEPAAENFDPYSSPTQSKYLLTEAGKVLGTFQYMPPEQLEGKVADARADIFAFGAVLYEMLTGKRAFEANSQAGMIAAILQSDPKPVTSILPVLPPLLDHVVQKCLVKDPDERWQSIHDVETELKWIMDHGAAAAVQSAAKPRSRIRAGALAAALLLAIAGAWWYGRSSQAEPPHFQQMTSSRGYIFSARFSPDSQTVIYGAAWGGKPLELFSTRVESIGSRGLGLASGDILSISSGGEMTMLINRRARQTWISNGTLAVASLSGGSHREILENVYEADTSPDGKTLVVVRSNKPGLQTLESPPDKVLMQTSGWFSHPRFSPDGKTIAFLEHPIWADDRGYISLVKDGKVRRVGKEWTQIQGLAWSPDGKELWFTATQGNMIKALRAMDLKGNSRLLWQGPVDLWLQDVHPSGRTLITANRTTTEVAALPPGESSEKLLQLFDECHIGGISADGRILAFTYSGYGSGENYLTYFGRVDGSSPPVQLGPGGAESISPDGKWVIVSYANNPEALNLVPTGPGKIQSLNLNGVTPILNTTITWTSDGSAFVFTGVEKSKGQRAYMMSVAEGSKPLPMTPENTTFPIVSPDGKSVLAKNQDHVYTLYSVYPANQKIITGMNKTDLPLQWDIGGKAVYVWNGSFPAKIERIELDSGKRTLWRELSPPDPSGLLYGSILLTPDGSSYAYRYRRVLSDLYLVTGLH